MAEIILEVTIIAFLCIAIHKIHKTKKKIDAISQAVENYLSIIMEEELSERQDVVNDAPKIQKTAQQIREEEQNRLISSVLQEIFP